MTPLELMQRARAQMLIQDRFYGILAMHLELKEDTNCPTAWTDGNEIGFNPEFISGLDDYSRTFIFKHEVWHCILGHHLRRGDRHPEGWNIAADRAIHYQFKHQEGMKLIPNCLYDPNDKGKNAEMIYDSLPKENKGQGQGKDGKGQQGSCIGEVRDAKGSGQEGQMTSSEKAQQEGKWTQALERAVKEVESQGRGSVPSFVKEMLEARKKVKINWKEVLRRFVQESCDSVDYNWMKPNKKYLAFDIYVPSLAVNVDHIEKIVLAVDTSGSMYKEQLDQVVDELSCILEEYNTQVSVLLIDTTVHKVLELTSEDLPLKIEAVGRGGTDFRPAFEWVEKNEIVPTCFLYYTDGDGYFPNKEPDYPVLWIGTGRFNPPFGEYVSCI